MSGFDFTIVMGCVVSMVSAWSILAGVNFWSYPWNAVKRAWAWWEDFAIFGRQRPSESPYELYKRIRSMEEEVYGHTWHTLDGVCRPEDQPIDMRRIVQTPKLRGAFECEGCGADYSDRRDRDHHTMFCPMRKADWAIRERIVPTGYTVQGQELLWDTERHMITNAEGEEFVVVTNEAVPRVEYRKRYEDAQISAAELRAEMKKLRDWGRGREV